MPAFCLTVGPKPSSSPSPLPHSSLVKFQNSPPVTPPMKLLFWPVIPFRSLFSPHAERKAVALFSFPPSYSACFLKGPPSLSAPFLDFVPPSIPGCASFPFQDPVLFSDVYQGSITVPPLPTPHPSTRHLFFFLPNVPPFPSLSDISYPPPATPPSLSSYGLPPLFFLSASLFFFSSRPATILSVFFF